MSSKVAGGGDRPVSLVGVECKVHVALRCLQASLSKVAGRSGAGMSVGVACVAGCFLLASGTTVIAQMQSIPHGEAAMSGGAR
jgi:hypothetical protein